MRRGGRIVPKDQTWTGPTGKVKPFYTSYEEAVKWPALLQGFTVVRDVPFTTKAGLDSALAGITAGDYIHYTGTGKLTIASSAGNAYTITAAQPAALALVDFGMFASGNYVEFSYTGTASLNGIWVRRPHNVFFIGGSATAPAGANGILWYGGQTSGWYDFYVHDVGTDGFYPGGASTDEAVSGCRWRGEITSWGLVPAHDSHVGDPGSGIHGVQFSDANSLDCTNNTLGVYVHDGGAGAGVQIGDSPAGINVTGNTIFLKAKNLTFKSSLTSSCANGIQMWGPAVQTSNAVELVQVEGCQGQAVFASSLTSASCRYTVKRGRAKSVNLSGRSATKYDTSNANVVYQDAR